MAEEFDTIHSVQRAVDVGSLDGVLKPAEASDPPLFESLSRPSTTALPRKAIRAVPPDRSGAEPSSAVACCPLEPHAESNAEEAPHLLCEGPLR